MSLLPRHRGVLKTAKLNGYEKWAFRSPPAKYEGPAGFQIKREIKISDGMRHRASAKRKLGSMIG